MPSLSDHQSSKLTKLLLIGNSGAGKTGALVSLVKAGYKLRILDFDNGLDSLRILIKQHCPDKIGNVQYVTLRDKYRGTDAGFVVDGVPKAYPAAAKLLEKWEDGTVPATWGEDHILVIDSLTFLSEAAFNWATAMNPAAKDKRQIYGAAQDSVETMIARLTSEAFGTNVIMVAHVKFLEQPDRTQKGFPTSIGNALSPKIPAYFNHYALCENIAGKRSLRLQSTGLVDTKSPVSFRMAASLPIESALADFFAEVRK